MRCTDRLALAVLLIGCLALAAGPASAQDDPLPPGIRAGQEAYQHAEAERRAAVGAQVELNSIMRSRVPWASPYGETIYYAPPGHTYGSRFPGGELGYGVSMHAHSYQPRSYLGTTAAFGLGTYHPYPSLFAYAYPPPPIRQPIGRRQVQTGPRRWESYPIYGDETPDYRDETADDVDETPEPPPVPMPPRTPRRHGPREF